PGATPIPDARPRKARKFRTFVKNKKLGLPIEPVRCGLPAARAAASARKTFESLLVFENRKGRAAIHE
ncbi:MAG TPA: hypothetical protein VKI45_10585, partial [Allosphingosinicella sp.]|nr:hypothetical protein [Allosphingosinicella sp.]